MEKHPVSGRPPSVTAQSFSCPHCGAYTSQTWARYYGRNLDRDSPLPPKHDLERWEAITAKAVDPEKKEQMERVLALVRKVNEGMPFTDSIPDNERSPQFSLINVHTSRCYVCSDLAVWIHNRMIYPQSAAGEPAHADLPNALKADFEEARAILERSPRGAAALLRLCVQKLCHHLGEKGENINDDIASMVRKGLASEIQQALDAVRVIGNEAVHPGTMNLKDDRATAADLLSIVNFIVDEMITKPAKLRAIYQGLPADKLKGIEQRNARALGEAKPAA